LLAGGHAVTLTGPGPDENGGRVDGFVFDDGPGLITAPWLIQELFDLSGRVTADYVTLVPLDPFYNIRFDDGAVFRYSAHHDDVIRQIRQRNVDDVRGYLRYRDAAAHAFDTSRQDKSVARLVRTHIRDERLRQVFTATSWLAGAESFRPASTHTLEQRWGVWYPMGGTPALHAALLKLARELGGDWSVGVDPPDPVPPSEQPLFVMSFGTDRQYPDMAHHEILVAPDTWVYVHHPTATDASLAPPGSDSWSILTPMPDRDSIVHFLEARALPSLARHIVAERRLTCVNSGDRPGTGLPGALDAGKRHAIEIPGC
jgi:phytoene desaturase